MSSLVHPQYGNYNALSQMQQPMSVTKTHYANPDGSKGSVEHNRFTAATRSCWDIKITGFDNTPIGWDGINPPTEWWVEPFRWHDPNEPPPKSAKASKIEK